MKITKISVELKQGLPNYSSRAASVEAVADEGETLDPVSNIKKLTEQIKTAWFVNSLEKETKKKDILDDD